MADIWQNYGSWILYGIFFVLMVLMHTGMHGHAGHSRGRTTQDREAAGSGAPAEGAAERNAQVSRPDVSSMLTGLLLWLCSLPLIALFVLPWFGARVAVVVALVLLAATASTCYALCTWRDVAPEKGTGRRPS